MSFFDAFAKGIFPKLVEQVKGFLCPLHREGWVIILIFISATLVLFHLATFLGMIGVVLSAWCAYFFRDPSRMVPQIPSAIISPADGVLLEIHHVVPPKELGLPDQAGSSKYVRLSIFMNVFNVHVNRYPISGVLTHVSYHPGTFHNAALDKAAEQNEHKNYVLKTDGGDTVAFVQVAGLLARRIRSAGEAGDRVQAGVRFGIIRFGSRVDVYVPLHAAIRVAPGQIIVGGETVLADLGGGASVTAIRI